MLIIEYNGLLIFKSCHLLSTQLACPENTAVLSNYLCILSHCNCNKQNVANSDGIIITLHSQKAPQKITTKGEVVQTYSKHLLVIL
jgi:hypothetical protein